MLMYLIYYLYLDERRPPPRRRNRGVYDEKKNMCMLDEIRAKRDEIYAIARRHKAEKLWVFGSCARKEERPDSDVDFLVKFDPSVSHKDYTAIEQGLSSRIGRTVDVVSTRILPSSPRFANRVCREAVAI